jgi:hypothetical protein
MLTPNMMMGLRFQKSQARILRNLAERAKARELAGAVSLFEKAAEAAAAGEPLLVACTAPEEAVAMAAGFSQYGVVPPTIEHRSG